MCSKFASVLLGYYGQWTRNKSTFTQHLDIVQGLGLVRLVNVPLPKICIPVSTNDTEKVKPKY